MALFKAAPSFAGGELAPGLYGRTDLQKYDIGASTLENMIVLRYGGVARRPGFKHIAQTAGNKKARLLPFRYSTDQNYVVEVTAGAFRFYTDGGIVVDAEGQPYEVKNDFKERDLPGIKYTQSADVLFLTHPDHPPQTLTRHGVASWKLDVMKIVGGPFEDPEIPGEAIIRHFRKEWREPGKYSFTLPENIRNASIEVAGAGGGGFLYGRGGAGELKSHILSADEKTLSITVGKGGWGSATKCASGEASSVESNSGLHITANGGAGGRDGGKDGAGNRVGGAGGLQMEDGSPGWVILEYTTILTPGVGISASDTQGEVTLTATEDLFDEMDEGTLLALNYFVETDVKKGNPSTDSLQVDALPKAGVYIESSGFWNGNFTIEKYDRMVGTWVKLRTQHGNRSQNYNFTETNDADEIVPYRVTSTEFNTEVRSGENDKQRGELSIQSLGNNYSGIVYIKKVKGPREAVAVVRKRLPRKEATKDFAFAAWNRQKGYPCCCGFFEDRLVLAGSREYPQTYWLSKPGDYFNFSVSIPAAEDDAIVGTLNNGQMNGVQAIVTFSEMLMQTAGGTYKVSGGNDPMTFKNQQSKPQEYRGINGVTPVVVGNRIIYIQQMGNAVRDIGYSYDVDKYSGDDISLLAEHLFSGREIVGMTYQQVPNSIVWCVRDDGLLLGMTYIKEQEMFAWHHHTTQGRFVDVCSISGTTEDALYVVVERNGSYYVEVMAAQNQTADPAEQFYVDAGITLENVKEVTGLTWLEGQEIQMLADGNVLPEETVKDGRIKRPQTAEKLTLGLGYTSTLKTLPIEPQGDDGSYMSRKKRATKLMVLFEKTRGGLYGLSDDDTRLDEIKWRSNEPYNTPIDLFTGKKYVALPHATFDETQQVVVKQKDPLPMKILALLPEVVVSG